MYSYINRPLRPNNTSSNLGGISLYHGITILDPTRFRSPLHLGCATAPLHHHNSPPLLCYKADNQGDGSSPSNQQKADTTTTTKRKEEEWAAVLAALTDARKALEEQHLRECRRPCPAGRRPPKPSSVSCSPPRRRPGPMTLYPLPRMLPLSPTSTLRLL
jgi:hypothetical protein